MMLNQLRQISWLYRPALALPPLSAARFPGRRLGILPFVLSPEILLFSFHGRALPLAEIRQACSDNCNRQIRCQREATMQDMKRIKPEK